MSNRDKPWGRDEFFSELFATFPDLVPRIMDGYADGLIHCEMGNFSHCTDSAISEGNFILVKQHFSFMDTALNHATDELENAIIVSYLENIFFSETTPALVQARAMLTTGLEDALVRLEEHFASLGRHIHRTL
jgi:hypothetical protein